MGTSDIHSTGKVGVRKEREKREHIFFIQNSNTLKNGNEPSVL